MMNTLEGLSRLCFGLAMIICGGIMLWALATPHGFAIVGAAILNVLSR